jgi:hypothetical protein
MYTHQALELMLAPIRKTIPKIFAWIAPAALVEFILY